MRQKAEVKLKDFYSASLLKALGYPLVRLERGSGDFLLFVFEGSGTAAEADLQRYWERQCPIDAKTLVDSIRDLKTRIHQGI